MCLVAFSGRSAPRPHLCRFGGLISACNEVMESPVYVKTDKPLFWTHTVDKKAN